MKHILTATIFVFALSMHSHAAVPVRNFDIHSNIPDYLRVENFISLSVSQFEAASGQHLNFFQRLYFKKLQKKLSRSDYQKNSTVLDHYDVEKKKFKFDPLWFVLGSFIGPFALLFSYTSKQSKSSRLSALIGFGVFVIWFGWLLVF